MSISDIFTAFGVVMAGFAALLAAYYSRKTLEYSSRAELAERQANSHAEYANVLNVKAWLDQYNCNVRLWADEACECISMAIHGLELEQAKCDEVLFGAKYKISSLIDRGRWFFPNQWQDDYGGHKEPAYRGIRQPILDFLVEAHEAICKHQKNQSGAVHDELVDCQRGFVSEVQQVFNPRRRKEELDRIYAQFAVCEKLRDMPNK